MKRPDDLVDAARDLQATLEARNPEELTVEEVRVLRHLLRELRAVLILQGSHCQPG
jgi:hypothetical protein